MLKDPQILQIAGAVARHAAKRQSVIAENIANANTPGYKAKDIESFSTVYARNASSALKSHAVDYRTIEAASPGSASPNGNTVSLEDQVWRAGEAARSHDVAVTLYSKAISLLRASLGGR